MEDVLGTNFLGEKKTVVEEGVMDKGPEANSHIGELEVHVEEKKMGKEMMVEEKEKVTEEKKQRGGNWQEQLEGKIMEEKMEEKVIVKEEEDGEMKEEEMKKGEEEEKEEMKKGEEEEMKKVEGEEKEEEEEKQQSLGEMVVSLEELGELVENITPLVSTSNMAEETKKEMLLSRSELKNLDTDRTSELPEGIQVKIDTSIYKEEVCDINNNFAAVQELEVDRSGNILKNEENIIFPTSFQPGPNQVARTSGSVEVGRRTSASVGLLADSTEGENSEIVFPKDPVLSELAAVEKLQRDGETMKQTSDAVFNDKKTPELSYNNSESINAGLKPVPGQQLFGTSRGLEKLPHGQLVTDNSLQFPSSVPATNSRFSSTMSFPVHFRSLTPVTTARRSALPVPTRIQTSSVDSFSNQSSSFPNNISSNQASPFLNKGFPGYSISPVVSSKHISVPSPLVNTGTSSMPTGIAPKDTTGLSVSSPFVAKQSSLPLPSLTVMTSSDLDAGGHSQKDGTSCWVSASPHQSVDNEHPKVDLQSVTRSSSVPPFTPFSSSISQYQTHSTPQEPMEQPSVASWESFEAPHPINCLCPNCKVVKPEPIFTNQPWPDPEYDAVPVRENNNIGGEIISHAVSDVPEGFSSPTLFPATKDPEEDGQDGQPKSPDSEKYTLETVYSGDFGKHKRFERMGPYGEDEWEGDGGTDEDVGGMGRRYSWDHSRFTQMGHPYSSPGFDNGEGGESEEEGSEEEGSEEEDHMGTYNHYMEYEDGQKDRENVEEGSMLSNQSNSIVPVKQTNDSQDISGGGRGRTYKCRRCGVPKKGHKCPLDNVEEGVEARAVVKTPVARPGPPRKKGRISGGPSFSQPLSKPSTVKPSMKFRGKINTPISEVEMHEIPQNAKVLLGTGALEGLEVSYVDKGGKVMLGGTVRDGLIACGCNQCNGMTRITASEFERHAGSSARHPSDNIHVANGLSFKDLIMAAIFFKDPKKAGKAVADALRSGEDSEFHDACGKCKKGGYLLCCDNEGCPQVYHPECVGLSSVPEGVWLCLDCSGKSSPVPAKVEETALVVRKPSPPQIVSTPARVSKRDPGTVHKALFLPGGLPNGTNLSYFVKGKKILAGKKDSTGILCDCCNTLVSCSQFEMHAGFGSRRNPYNSIYMDDGRSLHEAALALSQVLPKGNNGQEDETEYQSTETSNICSECGDGMTILSCRNCPTAYHPECIGLLHAPRGNWYCPACRKDSGVIGNGRGQRECRVEGGKKGEREGCRHIANDAEAVGSGCVLCRSGSLDFAKSGFGPRTIMLCDQCEREFHVGCLKSHGLADLKELPEGEWFCGKDCEMIHASLRQLVEMGPLPLPSPSSMSSVASQLSKKTPTKHFGEQNTTEECTWQLLRGRRNDPEKGLVLGSVMKMFSESFVPIIDGVTGRNLIPLIVHSRNTRDHDFGGMYCAVLKRRDEVVSAACIRVLGQEIAEMPLVATATSARRQGHCKTLLTAIEWLLGSLGVETLCLPAAEGAEGTWLDGFGFVHVPEKRFNRLKDDLQMLVFPGSSALEKTIRPLTSPQKSQTVISLFSNGYLGNLRSKSQGKEGNKGITFEDFGIKRTKQLERETQQRKLIVKLKEPIDEIDTEKLNFSEVAGISVDKEETVSMSNRELENVRDFGEPEDRLEESDHWGEGEDEKEEVGEEEENEEEGRERENEDELGYEAENFVGNQKVGEELNPGEKERHRRIKVKIRRGPVVVDGGGKRVEKSDNLNLTEEVMDETVKDSVNDMGIREFQETGGEGEVEGVKYGGEKKDRDEVALLHNSDGQEREEGGSDTERKESDREPMKKIKVKFRGGFERKAGESNKIFDGQEMDEGEKRGREEVESLDDEDLKSEEGRQCEDVPYMGNTQLSMDFVNKGKHGKPLREVNDKFEDLEVDEEMIRLQYTKGSQKKLKVKFRGTVSVDVEETVNAVDRAEIDHLEEESVRKIGKEEGIQSVEEIGEIIEKENKQICVDEGKGKGEGTRESTLDEKMSDSEAIKNKEETEEEESHKRRKRKLRDAEVCVDDEKAVDGKKMDDSKKMTQKHSKKRKHVIETMEIGETKKTSKGIGRETESQTCDENKHIVTDLVEQPDRQNTDFKNVDSKNADSKNVDPKLLDSNEEGVENVKVMRKRRSFATEKVTEEDGQIPTEPHRRLKVKFSGQLEEEKDRIFDMLLEGRTEELDKLNSVYEGVGEFEDMEGRQEEIDNKENETDSEWKENITGNEALQNGKKLIGKRRGVRESGCGPSGDSGSGSAKLTLKLNLKENVSKQNGGTRSVLVQKRKRIDAKEEEFPEVNFTAIENPSALRQKNCDKQKMEVESREEAKEKDHDSDGEQKIRVEDRQIGLLKGLRKPRSMRRMRITSNGIMGGMNNVETVGSGLEYLKKCSSENLEGRKKLVGNEFEEAGTSVMNHVCENINEQKKPKRCTFQEENMGFRSDEEMESPTLQGEKRANKRSRSLRHKVGGEENLGGIQLEKIEKIDSKCNLLLNPNTIDQSQSVQKKQNKKTERSFRNRTSKETGERNGESELSNPKNETNREFEKGGREHVTEKKQRIRQMDIRNLIPTTSPPVSVLKGLTVENSKRGTEGRRDPEGNYQDKEDEGGKDVNVLSPNMDANTFGENTSIGENINSGGKTNSGRTTNGGEKTTGREKTKSGEKTNGGETTIGGEKTSGGGSRGKRLRKELLALQKMGNPTTLETNYRSLGERRRLSKKEDTFG